MDILLKKVKKVRRKNSGNYVLSYDLRKDEKQKAGKRTRGKANNGI